LGTFTFSEYLNRFCQETELWLRNTAQRGTLISGSSEKERFKFFNAQRQKIENLMQSLTV